MSKITTVEKISRYMDAGFPIIYFNTFEELKGMQTIIAASGARQVLEWSYTDGLILYKNGEVQGEYKNDLAKIPLANVLEQLLIEDLYNLEGKVVVFKDIHHYLEDTDVISLMKGLINKINSGSDFSIVFLSSVVKIPKELEKFITISEAEYMEYDEIRKTIVDFIEYQELPKVADKLLDELAMAFKGLTRFEINNLLALAYSDDGELTRKDLNIIFEQKKQMIMKSGILEMINVKESIDDIGGLENLKEWFNKKAKVDLEKNSDVQSKDTKKLPQKLKECFSNFIRKFFNY